MRSDFSLTRRGVLIGIATLPVLSPMAAEASVRDRADDLARRLFEMQLPHAPARLDLVRYGEGDVGRNVLIEAVVKLTWPPGFRTRMIRVEARDVEAGFEAVELRAFELFANPR